MFSGCSRNGGCPMRFDFRNPPRALVIVLIAILAIGVGFLGDFLITCVEKQIYPRTYEEYVTIYADRYGVPENIIYAVIKSESGFDSGAVSDAGAVGLMQLMPETFADLTDRLLYEHLESGMLYDPETNIRYGVFYLSHLYNRYGDWTCALAAYNAGPGRVDEWLEDPQYADGEGGLSKIPFKETRNYIKKVWRAQGVYERLYGEDAFAAPAEPATTPVG